MASLSVGLTQSKQQTQECSSKVNHRCIQ